jgi:hypothetical protein
MTGYFAHTATHSPRSPQLGTRVGLGGAGGVEQDCDSWGYCIVFFLAGIRGKGEVMMCAVARQRLFRFVVCAVLCQG